MSQLSLTSNKRNFQRRSLQRLAGVFYQRYHFLYILFWITDHIFCISRVTMIAAIRLSEVNMAISNIFGSNAFNIGIIGLIDLTLVDPLLNVVQSSHSFVATSAILINAVAVPEFLYHA